LDLLVDVKLAQKGDKEAFVRIIRRSEASLYQASRAILNSDDDCADAIQETILNAYRSIHRLKEPAYFRTWIIRILINECKRLLKLKNNVIPFHLVQEPSQYEHGFSRIELQEEVDRLEEDLHTIIRLYYYCDLSIKDIAEVLELPDGTVKSRLYRAREVLYRQMNRPNKGVNRS